MSRPESRMSDISVLSIDKGFKLESAFSEAFNSIKK